MKDKCAMKGATEGNHETPTTGATSTTIAVLHSIAIFDSGCRPEDHTGNKSPKKGAMDNNPLQHVVGTEGSANEFRRSVCAHHDDNRGLNRRSCFTAQAGDTNLRQDLKFVPCHEKTHCETIFGR